MEVLQDAQDGKISFAQRDHLLKPYEQYLERVLDDCRDMDQEYDIQNQSREEEVNQRIGAGLDMKRICEEI